MGVHERTNIALVGMPGAGKSTVGIILAKYTALSFVDTDVLIQSVEKRSLQEILDAEGYLSLRAIEEKAILCLCPTEHVVATGGSAVYSPRAMRHLKSSSRIVFLDVGLEELRRRISDFRSRGIARRPDQSFEELYRERLVLYRSYADVTVDGASGTQEEVARAVCAALRAP